MQVRLAHIATTQSHKHALTCLTLWPIIPVNKTRLTLLQVLWRGLPGSSVCPSPVDHTPAEAHPVAGIQGQKVSPRCSSGSPGTCPTSSRLTRHIALQAKAAIVLKRPRYLCRRRAGRTPWKVPRLGDRGRRRAGWTQQETVVFVQPLLLKSKASHPSAVYPHRFEEQAVEFV